MACPHVCTLLYPTAVQSGPLQEGIAIVRGVGSACSFYRYYVIVRSALLIINNIRVFNYLIHVYFGDLSRVVQPD